MPDVISRDDAQAAGVKRFFTGCECKHGHVAERFVTSGNCVACLAARVAANPTSRKLAQDKYYQTKREIILDRQASYRASNRDVVLEIKRRSAAKHIDKLRIARKAWADANPERVRAAGHGRRVKIRGSGSYTPDDLVRIRKAQRNKCACCRASLTRSEHIDHITAIAAGGTNAARNIQLLCGPCNWRKGAKHPIVFMQERGMLL